MHRRIATALPIVEWLPRYRRSDVVPDLVAGLTGAAIIVPQSMAYATIAGLPPYVGLYASVVPVLVYALVGRSRQLSVGPLATISIIAAVAIAKLAPTGSAQYIAYAATLALLVGGVHVALGVTRLGFLVRFLAAPVMTGFIAAVGVIVVTTQLGPLFGYAVPSSPLPVETVYDWAVRLDETSLATLALSAASLAVLFALWRRPRIPSALGLVIVSSVVTLVFDLDRHGIAVVGPVPRGLAGPELPPFDWPAVRVLLPTAVVITFIGFLESIAIAREYAERHGYEDDIDTNHELVALGLSNAAAGVFQGMIVTGAITRSSIVDATGARTQLSGAVSALVIVPLLVLWPDVFEWIPTAVLAAIVVVAVVGFVKVVEGRRLWRVARADFWLMLLAFATTMALGLEVGVLVAVAASVAMIVYRVTRPRIPELGREPSTRAFVEVGRHPGVETFPGVAILRVESALYFTNAESIERRLRVLVEGRPDLTTIVIDAGGINHLDSTADEMVRKVASELAARGVRILLVDVEEQVKDVMDASGLTALVGEDAFFATDADAVTWLEAATGTAADDDGSRPRA
jgi:SulP family sulfate permease